MRICSSYDQKRQKQVVNFQQKEILTNWVNTLRIGEIISFHLPTNRYITQLQLKYGILFCNPIPIICQ